MARSNVFVSGVGACVLAGLSMGAAADAITGAATYRERIALSPTATLEVTVEDVSRADAPATVIGRTSFMPTGQVPIHFEVPYDAAQVQPNHRYVVRARILEAGRLVFTTTQAYPVLTQGGGTTVDVLLQPVGQSAPAPDRPFVNTYWKLVSVGGVAAQAFPNQREPHFILRSELNRATGSGGCNEFTGTYEVSESAVRFGHAAATLRACPEGMEQEAAFFRVLEQARSFRIHGDQLELLDEGGAVLARFVAVDLK
jgi:putative lipoprotein